MAEITCQVIKQLFKNYEYIDQLGAIVSTAVEQKLEEIITNIETIQGNVFDLQSKLGIKEEQVNKLNKELDAHKGSIVRLQHDMDTMEQYSRGTSIWIFGIEEKPGGVL